MTKMNTSNPAMTPRRAETKPTNPKDAVGAKKPGLFHVPTTALFALAEAHDDGALKYGSHNWRTSGVRVSTYIEAIERHLALYKEGQDRSDDAYVHHLAHVMACCAIVIDAEACSMLNDDRPTAAPDGWMDEYRDRAEQRRGGS